MCMLIYDTQHFMCSGTVIVTMIFIFFVNTIDIFRQMLFSAETIKASQACISVDLLTMQSSSDIALTYCRAPMILL